MTRQRHRPRFVEPAPPSFLWATRTDEVQIECFARLFVSGIYVEVRIEGVPSVGRTFTTSDDAIAFSEQQRYLWVDRHTRGGVPRRVDPES
jgi:hypothetical protein